MSTIALVALGFSHKFYFLPLFPPLPHPVTVWGSPTRNCGQTEVAAMGGSVHVW